MFANAQEIFSSQSDLSWKNDPGSMFSSGPIVSQPVVPSVLDKAPTISTCGDQGSIIVLRRIMNKLYEKLHGLEPVEHDSHFYDFSSYFTYQDYKSIDRFLNDSTCAGLHDAENVLSKFIDDGHLERPQIQFTWLENTPHSIKKVLDFAPVIVIFVLLYMRVRHSVLAALIFSGYVLYYKDKYEETTKEAHIEHGKLMDYCSKPFYVKILHYRYFQTNCDNIYDAHHTTKVLPNPITMAIEYLSELAVKPFPMVMKNLGKGYEEFLNSFSIYSYIFGFIVVIAITVLFFNNFFRLLVHLISGSYASDNRRQRSAKRRPKKKKIADDVVYLGTTGPAVEEAAKIE